VALTLLSLTKQVKNILGMANGGTNSSSVSTGVARSDGTTITGAELSGDATTSGSNAVTVAKVNGTSVPTNAAADQLILTTASATGAWATIADTSAGGLALTYTPGTHSFGTIAVGGGGSFADNETPSGTIDGANDTFTLAHTPSPAASLQLFKNGQLMEAGGADYTLATATITYVSGAIPQTGDVHFAWYRY
jgi:hypothetical protein